MNDAEKIAEWLGFRLAERGGHLFHEVIGPKKPELFPDWLSFPEGEVAMMDKLMDNPEHELIHNWFRITFGKSSIGTFNCSIPKVNHQEEPYKGSGSNRNEALQKAILEMLEENRKANK